MESAVFFYFFCIGAGLSFGILTVAVPAFFIFRKLKGGASHAKQAKQRASL